MPEDRPKPERTPPDEAIERLIPRRYLRIQDGDVLITREAGGLRAESRAIYQLQIQGRGASLDRFASFENAAAKGEELATKQKVRLFYREHKHEPPFLLKDARP
jgi:hypothetical protein